MHYLMLEVKLLSMGSKNLKILFFGNNNVVLDTLIKNSNVMDIFCRPANINNESICKVKAIAKIHSIPVRQPSRKDLYRCIEYIASLNADLIVVCGYKYIIPKEVFTLPKFGTTNIHPSYLPVHRGQHVINWAIINGENETGVTIHFIDEGIDTGDIILQKKVPILFEDTAKTLHDKIYREACELLIYLLNCVASGKQIKRKKQDATKASYLKPRVPEDGRINWDKSGLEIYNLIRALVKPWPGAYSCIRGKKIIIWSAEFKNNYSYNYHSNGEIIKMSDSTLMIQVSGGQIITQEYTILNRKGEEIDVSLKIGDKIY